MATGPLSTFLRRLSQRGMSEIGTPTDAQLLERFVRARDEAAFEVLVWRHGPLVLGVCRRLLRHEQDAEDAFQATFLALARRAAVVRNGEALGAWLYRVAYRAALRARARCRPQQGPPPDVAGPDRAEGDALHAELQSALAEEIDHMPWRYRAPFVLCCLEGRTHAEVARQLHCPPGTVASRLAWARQRLRARLSRRGLAPAALLAGAAETTAAVPPSLRETTVEAALRFALGDSSVAAAPAALAQGVLRTMSLPRLKSLAVLVLTCALLGGGAAGLGRHALAVGRDDESAESVPGDPDALRLSPAAVDKWDIQTRTARARPAAPRTLELTGSLALDPNRLVRVHSPFAGTVALVATTPERGPARGPENRRPLQVGDRVRKGQLLAVVWCKDLTEKKGELIEALVRLWHDEELLASLEKLAETGQLPALNVRKQRKQVDEDRSAVVGAERALRTWHVANDEIQAVKEEARRIFRDRGERDAKKEAEWARVEVRATADGTIIEKNTNIGDVITPEADLFKLADLGRLLAVVPADENDLAALRRLPEGRRRWVLRLTTHPERPPITGTFDLPDLIDPQLRTAVVKGRVVNRGDGLYPGQRMTATIELPATPGVVVVPASALVEEGGAFYLFVQPDAAKPIYCQRLVTVVRRGGGVAHLRASALRPGERVVTSGAAELRAALLERRPN